jgi:hypothetical protein
LRVVGKLVEEKKHLLDHLRGKRGSRLLVGASVQAVPNRAVSLVAGEDGLAANLGSGAARFGECDGVAWKQAWRMT